LTLERFLYFSKLDWPTKFQPRVFLW
jgi:hypothetical protein